MTQSVEGFLDALPTSYYRCYKIIKIREDTFTMNLSQMSPDTDYIGVWLGMCAVGQEITSVGKHRRKNKTLNVSG